VVGEVRMAERARGEAEAAARDARLAMLRLQVDPHFLFNALNSAIALVQAYLMVHGLSLWGLTGFLRVGQQELLLRSC
jgi:LytS/YehU family sensor histidine kinase